MAESRLTPIRIPIDLLQAIDEHVGTGQRSKFIVEAAERELVRQRQLRALAKSAGAWSHEDHPELPATAEGMAEYMRQTRDKADRSRRR